MLILMEPTATRDQVGEVLALLESAGIRCQVNEAPEALSIVAPNASKALKPDRIEPMAGVRRVVPITSPYKLASADAAAGRTEVEVRGVRIGGPDLVLVGGPCGVESRDQLFTVARYVAEAGVKLLRAGAFKPRTSPYAFQGLGEEGLRILLAAKRETGLPVVTEVISPELVPPGTRCARCASRSCTGMCKTGWIRSGARSASGVSTNARSTISGWGMIRFSVWMFVASVLG